MAKLKRFKAPKPNATAPSTAVATTTHTIEGELLPPESEHITQLAKAIKRNHAGRPSKYSDRYATIALDYISNYQATGRTFPSKEGLCLLLGIDDMTLEAWSRDASKPRFFGLSEKLRLAQVDRLLDGGMAGKLNPVITKLVLGKHGYVSQSALGGNGMPIAVVAVNATKSMTAADIERLYFESLQRQ